MSVTLCQALAAPACTLGLTAADLSRLLAQARATGLLATLALQLQDSGHFDALPAEARRHLRSAVLAQAKQQRDLAYELEHLKPVFARLGERLTLLKGAAYLVAELRCGVGRVLSDIDLLVPQAVIDATEQALLEAGWEAGEKDPYDERYYRQWMHEIPPLAHPRRGSVLDVHHTILPPTATPELDADLLFAERRALAPEVFGLGREDMVLHSAAHLFFESEFPNGLRDLWDQYSMLTEFAAQDADFWPRLTERARVLDLETPLWLSLRYVGMHFDLQAPEAVLMALRPRFAGLRTRLWDFMFRRVFRPNHPDTRLALHDAALTLAYIRGHALRMPLTLLLPHLARKATRRFQDRGLLPQPAGEGQG